MHPTLSASESLRGRNWEVGRENPKQPGQPRMNDEFYVRY